MRKLGAVSALILTVVLVLLLNEPHGALPALGRLLDPIKGAWAAAEPVKKNFNHKFNIHGLSQPVNVWMDDRLVPHIHAANDHDLYFVQGFVHAYFRLWQMDLQTRAAAGRVSEILGDKALQFDRTQRRKGMVYGAENSLRAMEAVPRTKQMLDAYTAGINHFITSLNYREYPLEYKLMGFVPEPWTNLKSALLLKYMADDLTGYTEDIALTVIRSLYSKQDFENLFPERIVGSMPVIPGGTIHGKASMSTPPALPDSIAWRTVKAKKKIKHEESDGKGSNNWAVSGSRTQSGAAILCNDPHLGLNLPSLWFEVQLQAPGINCYGASLPGAPGVVIGFNDNIAWGFTNNYRDVKDFYLIEPRDKGYVLDGKVMPFQERIEKISIKGKPDYFDTVRYTIQGPVMYDEDFPAPGDIKQPLAMTWMAHRATNELLSLYLLNRANDYVSFVTAIQHFQCPAQNMIYADRQGNIALWGQGQFVNKWKGQGRYVMNGAASGTLWKELIPMNENPHVFNPPQGFLSSANQSVTDTTYPYWYNGYFYEFRAWRINQVLSSLTKATIKDMFALQNDVYSLLAANILPVMVRNIDVQSLTPIQKEYFDRLNGWDYRLTAKSKAASVFQIWSYFVYTTLWKDKFQDIPDNLLPSQERTMQIIKTDTAVDKVRQLVTSSFKLASDSLDKVDKSLEWYKVKKPMVRHLTKLPAFGYYELPIGGWGNTPNAMKIDHGPSWRMVVQLGKEIEAYGVYPGGQSGNPGSKYYADFLNPWVKGEYYKLLFLPNTAKQNNKALKYTWAFKPE